MPTNQPPLGPLTATPIAALGLLLNTDPSTLMLTHPEVGHCHRFPVLALHADYSRRLNIKF